MNIVFNILFVGMSYLLGLSVQNPSIVGTWVNESDAKDKYVFESSGLVYSYYDNQLVATYDYSISNSSPQCGVKVPIDMHTSYLKLTPSIKKLGDHTISKYDDPEPLCYEINGITEEHLSLRVVDMGGYTLFRRQ
ncbi:hypothetical protein [Marinoscillum sp.]|uniref:hypothetical protein n=1 Tax=Marinoscillum sp. TaxID=2024838 RepID=UPI003BA8EF81